jgi:spermidine/putrescine transport system permease protein
VVVSSQLYGLDKRIEEAALNLGANRTQTFFEVTLPLIARGVLAAMLFAFTISFQDVEASMLWATPSTVTLPVRIYTMIRDEMTPKINVIAVLMMVFSVGLPVIAERLSSRRDGRASGASVESAMPVIPPDRR